MDEEFQDLGRRVDDLRRYLDLPAKAAEIADLEALAAQPGFWDKADAAQAVLRRMNGFRSTIQRWESLDHRLRDLRDLHELAAFEGDVDVLEEVVREKAILVRSIEELELERMFDGVDDGRDAILSITPGAGGTEAQDWALMLMRQYARWMERKGFSSTVLDLQDADDYGIKGVTFEVKGPWAYGLLRPEIGVHRLVRISPFDANARRHTSFASVYAYPVVEDAEIPQLRMEDVRVDTYRASGAGGQHVNKTESAVRMTHHPTGIVVACQTERSQIQNRENCLKMLRAQLYQHYRQEEAKRLEGKMAKKLKIEWGSQIRNYVLDDRRVKDLRTGVETSDTERVLDGDLDPFIQAFLLMESEETARG